MCLQKRTCVAIVLGVHLFLFLLSTFFFEPAHRGLCFAGSPKVYSEHEYKDIKEFCLTSKAILESTPWIQSPGTWIGLMLLPFKWVYSVATNFVLLVVLGLVVGVHDSLF